MTPELTPETKPAGRSRLTSLNAILTVIVGIGLIVTMLAVRHLLNEIDDPRTGLKAIARDSARSRAQVSAVDAFLAGKFPEFGALSKILEAQKAADDGDFSEMNDLLKKARALFSDAQEHKVISSPDIFESAIENLNEIENSTPEASKAAGPVINDLRVLLANYRSALQTAPDLDAPFLGAAVRTPTEISHQSIKGGSPAIANANPLGQLALMVSDVRIIRPAFQLLDGIRWRDVTFVDTSIEYNGGPVELTNVRFINCDFIVHAGPNATKFLEYAALDRHVRFSIPSRDPRS
jgi:hypothetical protein